MIGSGYRMESAWDDWNCRWATLFLSLAAESMNVGDAAHDVEHVRRVLQNAFRIGIAEGGIPEVILPAIWLHDAVVIPKNSPLRSEASRMAAEAAMSTLASIDYPAQFHSDIYHAIHAHSFSARIECKTLEARIVQDADRLDSIGSIGIIRCLLTGAGLGQQMYLSESPFPVDREPRDASFTIDHFFVKLLRIPQTMQTQQGTQEAKKRTQIMLRFLKELGDELGLAADQLSKAMASQGIDVQHEY